MRCRVASLIPPRPCNARSTVPIDTFAISAIKWIPCLSLPIGTTPWDILHLQNCSASYTMLFACTLTVLYFARFHDFSVEVHDCTRTTLAELYQSQLGPSSSDG